MPTGTLQCLPLRDQRSATAFHSPVTIPAFAGSIPGSEFPTYRFTARLADFLARSASRLHRPDPVCTRYRTASTPRARCQFLDQPVPPPFSRPLPFGTFRSLPIKAFRSTATDPVRLPDSPDLLSLPAAPSIASLGRGSTFQVRYVSGGLLFLKPLGTFSTMIPLRSSVNIFWRITGAFQQDF
jgi:hypothetical protein